MALIVKLLRILFLYAVFLVLTAIALPVVAGEPEGWSALALLIIPAIVVWLFERKRGAPKRAEVQPLNQELRRGHSRETPIERSLPAGGNRAASVLPPDANLLASGEAPKRYIQDHHSEQSSVKAQPLKWFGKNEVVNVAGRQIDGLVYLGSAKHGNRFRGLIDPELSVANDGSDPQGQGLPYWPAYSAIPPQSRASYLDWLAGGRVDASYDVGYMFLFFYGLERRFFHDQPDEDEKHIIVDEVRRLKQLYAANGAAQRDLGDFLEVARFGFATLSDPQPVFEKQGWELPLGLRAHLGAMLARGESLNADWVLSWLMCHPETYLRTPAIRCVDEFRALFRLRFEQRFPDGMKIAKPRKLLKARYQAASGEFNVDVNVTLGDQPVPDISGLRKPLETAREIANEATDELDKLSRYLGRNPDGRGSLEAYALLPRELWPQFPSAAVTELTAWARDIVAGDGLVSVDALLKRLEGEAPVKIGRRQLTDAADALARIGCGMAPDPRFALRGPKAGEPVVLFDLGQPVEHLETVSPAYRGALIALALGGYVAHADGHVSEAERQSLRARIEDVPDLAEHERRRLNANLDWMLAVPPDLALLRRRLKDVGPDGQAAMRAAVVTTAHADGTIHAGEVAGIERLYRALGLDPSLAYSDLHAAEADGPVTMRAARPAPPGEAILPEAPVLDAARIAAIRQDTAHVSSVLGAIFASDADDVPDEESALDGLDDRHTALVRDLVAQDHWTTEAFEALCARHGVMTAGALETVNEWAFAQYDDALLDEYDGYEVLSDAAAAVKNQLNKETVNVPTATP